VLRSSLEAAEKFDGEVVGQRTSGITGKTRLVRRFQASTPTTSSTGEIGAVLLWAGESVGSVTRVQPAGEIVHELAEKAERLLRRWGCYLAATSPPCAL